MNGVWYVDGDEFDEAAALALDDAATEFGDVLTSTDERSGRYLESSWTMAQPAGSMDYDFKRALLPFTADPKHARAKALRDFYLAQQHFTPLRPEEPVVLIDAIGPEEIEKANLRRVYTRRRG